MTTMTEMRDRLHNQMGQAVECGMADNYKVLAVPGTSLFVARYRNDQYGGEYYTYHAVTHWGSGALTLQMADGQLTPTWSSGGVCEDATGLDIAAVMLAVWKDAEELMGSFAILNGSAEDVA